MMTTQTRLSSLTSALRRLATSDTTPHRIAEAVADHLRTGAVDDSLRRELIAGAGSIDSYRTVVHAESAFSVQTVAWTPGMRTPIHDHTAWCVVAVLAGDLVEWRYLDRGDHLVVVDEMSFPAGRVDGFAPPGDIHHVHNPGAEPAVSLHIYGADLRGGLTSVRRTYDLPATRPRRISAASRNGS